MLENLNPGEQREILSELDNLYREDPWLWMTSEVFTIDEATQSKRPWPDKPYLEDLISALQSETKLVIPKSRRMMVSWTMAAWSIFKARYFPGNAIFYQSETENKSAYIVDKRCCYIENNLREPKLRRKYHSIKTNAGLVGRVTYDQTDSYIWAIPQGDSVIRTYTFSLLVCDESDFQPEGVAALDAALSIAEEGKSNQIVLLTTSNGPTGVCAEICRGAGFSRFV